MIPIRHVQRAAAAGVELIDRDRARRGSPVDYGDLKDGMFEIHKAYQDVVLTIKAGKDLPEKAVIPLTKLAAAATKMAGEFCSLHGWQRLEQFLKAVEEHRDDPDIAPYAHHAPAEVEEEDPKLKKFNLSKR